jgi:tyrosyl-tRNA synthetase
MAQFKSEFLNIVQARGFLHQCTDEEALDAALTKGVVTAYNGYDCTASSLHVGHLLPIMLQRWFQKCGHRPIVLMGVGTTKVGDPTGKDESRPLLTDEQIAANMTGIRQIFSRLLDLGDEPKGASAPNATTAFMVNNDDWLSQLNYIEFLRDIGPHFTINRMLTMDSVKLRLEREQAMSFLEFNYMLLQAYDFLELRRRHGCTLQTAGSDQWGNIVAGVELNRRVDGAQVFGLTTPLLTTASGAKMGKTAGGAVWLNADMLPVFDFWQYWRNTEDGDVGRFLKLFTELPLDEIARLEALKDAEINEAKKILATEVTALVHGREAADAAASAARGAFGAGGGTEGLPVIEVARAKLEAGIAAFELLRETGLTKSGGEARRLIKGGGVRLNDAPVTEEDRKITAADLSAEGSLKISLGKKRHVLVRAV